MKEAEKIINQCEAWSKADQKKFIGNAVEVTIARKWCEALCAELRRYKTKKTA